MKKQKFFQNVLLIFFAAILFLSMLLSLYRIFSGQITNVVALSVSIIAQGFTLFYILWGYRKPHGNLLRYAMLIYAASGIPFITNTNLSDFEKIVWVCIIFLVGYVSGRLHKFRQNVILGVIILILNIVKVCYPIVVNSVDILTVLRTARAVLIWASLLLSYIVRFNQHKLAGLLDKSEHTIIEHN